MRTVFNVKSILNKVARQGCLMSPFHLTLYIELVFRLRNGDLLRDVIEEQIQRTGQGRLRNTFAATLLKHTKAQTITRK